MTLVCPQWGSGAQTSAGHVPTEVMLHAMPAPTARLLHSYARKPRLPTIRLFTHAPPWSRIRPSHLVLNQCATLFIYGIFDDVCFFRLVSSETSRLGEDCTQPPMQCAPWSPASGVQRT